MERLCTLNAATLSTRTHLMPKPARLEVIQGHTFWDHWKADEGLRIILYNNLSFRVWNFEWKAAPAPAGEGGMGLANPGKILPPPFCEFIISKEELMLLNVSYNYLQKT